jgi:hypothetical protein
MLKQISTMKIGNTDQFKVIFYKRNELKQKLFKAQEKEQKIIEKQKELLKLKKDIIEGNAKIEEKLKKN